VLALSDQREGRDHAATGAGADIVGIGLTRDDAGSRVGTGGPELIVPGVLLRWLNGAGPGPPHAYVNDHR
jgi:hypothetical protein